MSHRALNEEQFGPFFHGTKAELKPGEHIESGKAPRTSYLSIHGQNYFTPSYYNAAAAARAAGGSRIYKVEPTGEYGDDPGSFQAFRSKHPLRVVGEADPAPGTWEMRALAKTYRTPRVQHGPLYRSREEDPEYEKDAAYIERRIYE